MPNPIKQKFIDHMELYQLSKQTQKGYISGVRCLAKHYSTEEVPSEMERNKKSSLVISFRASNEYSS